MEEVTNEFIMRNKGALELGVALLLGALIGLERGWANREKESGERVAGIRTYALVGLFGGIAALLSERLTPWAFPFMFVSIAAIGLVAWRAQVTERRDYSITGLVGLLLTFCFGAIAVSVDVALATACAVITAVILDNKHEIHGLLHKMQANELAAGLKLLLISVVMLPLLPNEDLGPGGVLNPYGIWWMVVMIASISFVGYFAMRVGGAEKGILFTSIFAGLSSSTALTLHFARLSRHNQTLAPLLAAGILLACGTMFPRILVYTMVINPALLPQLVVPVAAMGGVLYVCALVIWRTQKDHQTVDRPERNQNPLDLRMALFFGVFLTLVLLLGQWLQELLGNAGVYLLAASSGVADVNAVTLSLTRMAQSTIEPQTAMLGIVIAASVNNVVKTAMATGFGTAFLGLRVGVPIALSLLAGFLTAWLV
ncbi:MgtC/SapB family protein [Halomonas sp. Bachu 37]|uniref:MgtC/SapB family protein n=1 Tax=Halomonas kashgarensis TaxID=3084920 RepID=UPI003216F0FC